jgi:hypothetical protein
MEDKGNIGATAQARQPALVNGAASVSALTGFDQAQWHPMERTDWFDGRDVVLLANGMEVQARYCPGEWSEDTPIAAAEYDGAVWSCFDDAFQFEIEEISSDPAVWCHGEATHWRELSPRPGSADTHPQGGDSEAATEIEKLRSALVELEQVIPLFAEHCGHVQLPLLDGLRVQAARLKAREVIEHSPACTVSNAPGQAGSLYEDAPIFRDSGSDGNREDAPAGDRDV